MHHIFWMALVLLLSPLTTALTIAGAVRDDGILVARHGISPRDTPDVPVDKLHCGNFNTADYYNAKDLIDGMWPSQADDCSAFGQTCRRVACKNTSAVYVCNDEQETLMLSCGDDVKPLADQIHQKCCRSQGNSGGQSGQAFNTDFGKLDNFNVVIAYGNCNHGVDDDHPGMGPPDDPWGPNGECKKI